MSAKYLERTGYQGDSAVLIADISNQFELGTVQNSEVLAVGFEDCNIKVRTDSGRFVIKAFSKLRDDEGIDRYANVMQAVIAGGVHHPPLHASSSGDVVLRHPSGVTAVAMDFIEGSTYFDTKTVPTDEELELIAAEAVKIHSLDLRPPFVFDSWAIANIHNMYDAAEPFLDEGDRQLARAAVDRYDSIDLDQLTSCFVHGDIISTNTLRGADGKIWILDFACSNVYPKVQELAVMASSLLADDQNFIPLSERVERVKKAYLAAGGQLTEYEQQALLDYAIAGAAMEFVGGHKAKFIDKEDPKECDYWIGIGRRALQQALL